MNNGVNKTTAEDEVSPVENEDANTETPGVTQPTAPLSAGNNGVQLSDGLFLPFGLEDSTFYRNGSRALGTSSGTGLEATSGGHFYDGLIPVDENEVSPITPTSEIPITNDEENPLNANLLGLLGPQHLAAPAPRWAVPPQWLQFQMLRSYDEGLILSERQEAEMPLGVPRSSLPDEAEAQVQSNLQSLLERQTSASSDPSPRWEVLPQWIQPSLEEETPSFMKPQIQDFYDGLIAVDSENTSDLARQLPLMREPSVPEDERQMQANLMSLLQPLVAQNEQRAPSITSSPSIIEANKDTSLPQVICNFGLMRRAGVSDRKLQFEGVNFSSKDSPLFSKHLKAHASKSLGLMFLIITDWQLWFLDSLRSALPDFPIQTLLQLSSPKAATMLPTIDHNEGELSCIMEHINTRDQVHEKPDDETEINVGRTRAQCLPIVVWTRAENAIDGQPTQPLIVVISRCKRDISSQITSHYLRDDYKRWDRLNGNHAWVYLDLYFLFTRWDRVWGAVKQNLSIRTEQVVRGRDSIMPILEQTRQLHNDNNVMISLREHVRIHKASLKVVKQRVDKMLGGPEWLDTQHLKGRLEDAFELLEYYDVTATTLLEQQQNLLSLAFNLETVAQGQAVGRLNALALIFLPLSYVASIFGITTFDAPSKWYPVAAVPVLLTTILVAYVSHRYFTSQSSKPHPHPSHLPNLDPENQPPSRSPNWTRIFSLSRTLTPAPKPYTAQNSYHLHNMPPNDPSRLARRSTDRSLAAPHFVPPLSTVQYLPGAYDLSSGLMPNFGETREGSGMEGDVAGRVAGRVGKEREGEGRALAVLRRPFGLGGLDERMEM